MTTAAVVCRLEQLSYVETKVLRGCLHQNHRATRCSQVIIGGNVFATIVGLGGLVGLAIAKSQDTFSIASNNVLPIVNVSVLSVTSTVLLCATCFAWRAMRKIGKPKSWWGSHVGGTSLGTASQGHAASLHVLLQLFHDDRPHHHARLSHHRKQHRPHTIVLVSPAARDTHGRDGVFRQQLHQPRTCATRASRDFCMLHRCLSFCCCKRTCCVRNRAWRRSSSAGSWPVLRGAGGRSTPPLSTSRSAPQPPASCPTVPVQTYCPTPGQAVNWVATTLPCMRPHGSRLTVRTRERTHHCCISNRASPTHHPYVNDMCTCIFSQATPPRTWPPPRPSPSRATSCHPPPSAGCQPFFVIGT